MKKKKLKKSLHALPAERKERKTLSIVKEPKRKAGRPKAFINWEEVSRHMEAGSTGVDIAAIYGITPKNLYERSLKEHNVNFQELSRQKRAKGNERLRAKQYYEAMQGNVPLLIWLGKQRLGQRDKHEMEHSVEVRQEIIFYGDCTPKTWAQEQIEIETDGIKQIETNYTNT